MTIKYDCNEGCLFNVPNLKWLKMKTIIIEGDKHLINKRVYLSKTGLNNAASRDISRRKYLI